MVRLSNGLRQPVVQRVNVRSSLVLQLSDPRFDGLQNPSPCPGCRLLSDGSGRGSIPRPILPELAAIARLRASGSAWPPAFGDGGGVVDEPAIEARRGERRGASGGWWLVAWGGRVAASA
jgi:hypothetical protein